MAINLPIVTQFSDKGLKSAKAAFANFKTDVNNASGAMGKFKAGSNAALGAVKANAGALAVAGGAALATFAVKAVTAFQETALAAGKFADATGLSVEEASRLIEVSGDLGVEAGSVETAINKMNKTLGGTPEVFAKFGAKVIFAKNGSVDANETFLQTIDLLNGIKDPAKRAAAGTELLGKGFKDLGEIIAGGSDSLRASLDDIASGQVITDAELKKAREFRATMDDLNDLLQSFTIEAGGAFVEIVADIKDGTSSLDGFGRSLQRGTVGQVLSAISGLFNDNAENAELAAAEAKRLGDAYSGYVASRLAESRGEITKLNEALEAQAVQLDIVRQEFLDYIGELDVTVKLGNLKKDFAELFTAGIKAFSGTTADVQTYNESLLTAANNTMALATALNANAEQTMIIKIAFQTGDFARVESMLEVLRRGLILDPETMRFAGRRAMGGPVSSGSTYLVGERGPELFTPAQSGNITPNSAIGGNIITVNVQGADPQAVVRALQDYNRTAGPVPVNTRGN